MEMFVFWVLGEWGKRVQRNERLENLEDEKVIPKTKSTARNFPLPNTAIFAVLHKILHELSLKYRPFSVWVQHFLCFILGLFVVGTHFNLLILIQFALIYLYLFKFGSISGLNLLVVD